MVDDLALAERRLLAAQASGGISADSIYSTLTRLIHEYGLSGDLLDFGAGTGSFTGHLASMARFRSVTGADILARPDGLPQRVAWVRADLNLPLILDDASFDVIVAAETIEHLENPRATMREWCRLLRAGGALLMSTPNNESWRSMLALLFTGHYALFGPASYPAHITPLLRKDIERAAVEAGFERPLFRYTHRGVIPRMGGLRWQTVSGGLLRGLRFSDNVAAVMRKPVRTGMDSIPIR